MKTEQVSVLVVDDSALMRNLIKKIVESDPELKVAGIAMNGRFALQKIPLLHPDIIVLDLEMPEMNGIEFLKERQKNNIDIPVVILSAVAKKGAEVTMEALALGASDFITKPSGSISEDIEKVAERLKHLLKAYGFDYIRRQGGPDYKAGRKASEAPVWTPPVSVLQDYHEKGKTKSFGTEDWETITPLREPGKPEIIAIGISTGGPNALRKVFSHIDEKMKIPIIVVQHMPAGFTKEFAQSLDKICALEVKEAQEGDLIKPGRILIAPGDRHMKVEKKRLAAVAVLDDQDTINGHKPSVGYLFDSIAQQYQNRAMAIIMTGMGKDGSREIGKVYREGSRTIAQDERTCIVYGMPRVAVEHGYIREVLPLEEIADVINNA